MGDYATAVYLPHDPAKTIKLYGFLDLRPDLGLVRRDASPESSPARAMLTALVILAFMAVLFWNVYAYGRFTPLRIATATALSIGGVGAIGLGGALLWMLRAEQVRSRRKRRSATPRRWPAARRSSPTSDASAGRSATTAPS